MTQENRTLGVIFLTILLDLIGFGIIIPISPFFAESLGAGPMEITFLGAGFSLMQFWFAPFWGRVSDRVGRKPVILSSILIATVGYVLFAYASSYWMLVFARLLSGFGTANFGAAQAVIADTTPVERRAKGMGLLGAAFGLGFVLGPAVGGVLGQYGMRVPILTAAGLSFLNAFVALIFLPETRPAVPVAPTVFRSPLAQILSLGGDKNLRRLLWLYFIYSAAFSMMEQVLGLFIGHTWVGFVPSDPTASAGRASILTAWALIVVGVTMIVIQGGLIGRLVARYGEKRLLVAGCFIVAVSLILIPFCGYTGSFTFLLFDMFLVAVGSGITSPSVSSLLSRATAATEQGHVMGVGQSLSALGRVLGPASAGALYEVGMGWPFVLGGVLIAGCGYVGSRFRPVDHPAEKHA